MQDKNSLLYWYPKIKDLNVYTPKTEIIELKKKHSMLIDVGDGDFRPLEKQWDDILETARKIGFPLFMRTDYFSGKHNWKNTCYVEKEEDLKPHIGYLFEDSFCADMMGLPISALVFREFIPMKNLFTAFHGDMPVNPEIRYFIKDGKILCWHWYWCEQAIEEGTPKGKLPDNWREIIKEEKRILKREHLEYCVSLVAEKFKEGYWSIDFCQAKDGRWILIDIALGERSWHPEDCKELKKCEIL